MKVITLTQPWATLVAIGAKHIETRSWETLYRGPLAIHAAKGLGPVGGNKGLYDLCYHTEPFCSVLREWYSARQTGPFHALDYLDHQRGKIVATCDLVDVYRIQDGVTGFYADDSSIRFDLTDQERSFGDYTPGRFAWLLSNIVALETPIPAKGALGLWNYKGAL
jgi:activating signal cointegrator 1